MNTTTTPEATMTLNFVGHISHQRVRTATHTIEVFAGVRHAAGQWSVTATRRATGEVEMSITDLDRDMIVRAAEAFAATAV